MLDTVTIRVSTLVATDSVITSDREIGYSGAYNDPQTGRVQTKMFLEFRRTDDNESNPYAKYDSVTLILRPNGNYYGDTVKYSSLKIFPIKERIDKGDKGNLYSTNTVPVGAMLADTALRIKVKEKNNEIEIKLPHSFGKRMFEGILKDEDEYKTEDFLKTFPGLAVSPGEDSECVHGFLLNDTSCMIRIYYHISTTYIEDKRMTFKINVPNSFYYMQSDKANISDDIKDFNTKSDPLPSSKTKNRGIIMSGATSIYTRLDFPHLNELSWLGYYVKIQRATLYVRPVMRSFDTVPLPPNLNLYYFDPTSNSPLGNPMTMSSGYTAQSGNLPKNYQDIKNPDFPQYSFDVTGFISQQLGKTGYDKWALCLVIPPEPNERASQLSENTVQRLVFGDQNYWYKTESQSENNRVKLEIIYATYND
jgi:hypothetical protein